MSTVLEATQPITAHDALAELAIRKARQHLIPFTQLTHASYKVNWHHELIAEGLEAVERGECTRLMIFVPPQRGKSELASVRFPGWYIGKHSAHNVIETSYAADLATSFGRRVRNLLDTEEYQDIFPGIKLAEDSQAAGRWSTTEEGGLIAAGVGGGITGKRGNVIIIDDPFKDREQADSKTIRDKVDDWYRSVVFTRLAPQGSIILIMTRWHEDDLAGRLLKRMGEEGGDQWRVVSFPEVCEDPTEVRRKVGEVLWPSQYSQANAALTKIAVGSRDWEALFQQRPSNPKGNIIQSAWFQRFVEQPDEEKVILKVLSLDSAFKTKEENDFSALQLWWATATGFYLIWSIKRKLEFPELKQLVKDSYLAELPDWVLVEDKASGQSLIQELQRGTNIPIYPWKVDTDKVSRVHAVTPLMEAGRVYLPESASWVQDYLEECTAFKANAEHDDQVDATSQALTFMKKRSGARVSILG